MNVMITNIGRRGYLVDFLKASKNFNGKLYVSDCDMTASGLYGNNDGFFILPKPTDNEERYIEELVNCCKKNDISVIIPIIDPEVYILSKYKERFLKNNLIVLVSDFTVVDICYNKLKMNNFLEKNGFLYPKTYDNLKDFDKEYTLSEICFPVIIKPIYGSGSKDTFLIDSRDKLRVLFHEGLIIQEFLKGDEYGVDVFNTFEKKPVRCVVKKKIAMRSGETDKSLTIKDDRIQTLSVRIAQKLGHIGNLDCDIILLQDNAYIIDLNPRFGGGYLATHLSGINLLELLIKMLSKEHLEENFSDYKTNLLIMKTIGFQTIGIEKNKNRT